MARSGENHLWPRNQKNNGISGVAAASAVKKINGNGGENLSA